jgi:hypothetical protein
MTLLPLLVAAGMSQPAIAGDGVGLRLKVNSDLFQVQNLQAVDKDGEDIDNATGKTTTMGLFQGTPRFEATYVITPNIEAGLILGFANASAESDGDWTSTETTRRIGVTGSYNFKLADGLRGYAQPMLISGKATAKDEDGETLGGTSSLTYGLNLGLRVKLVKGATFDPGFEYLMGSGNQFDADGEAVEDVTAQYSSFGLKAGISVKF